MRVTVRARVPTGFAGDYGSRGWRPYRGPSSTSHRNVAPAAPHIRPTYCSMRAWTLLQHQIQTSPKVKVNGKEANIGYMKFFRSGEKIGLPSLALRVHRHDVCMLAP